MANSKSNVNEKNYFDIPVWRRYTLTIEEAAGYYHIGEGKLRMLIDQNPQFPFTDVIVPGSFFNGQRVSAPYRNVKIVLLVHIALAIRHRHLPPYINSLRRDGAFQTLRFSVLLSF